MPHLAVLALLSVALAIFFWRVTLENRVLSPADLVFTSYPWLTEPPDGYKGPSNPYQSDDAYIFYPRRWSLFHDNESSWWQEDYLSGGRNGFLIDALGLQFYPPAWVYHVFPFPVANSLYPITVVLAAGLSMYLLLWQLRLPWLASVYGSVVYAFNAHFIVWLGHAHLPASLGLVPLMLFGFERHRETRQPLYLLIPAICLSLIVFIAYIPAWIVAGTVLIVYGLVRLTPLLVARKARDALGLAGTYVATGIVGLGLSAYALLPSVVSAAESGYQTGRDSGLGHYPLDYAWTYLFSGFWGTFHNWIGPVGNAPEATGYAGVATLPLALLGFWHMRRHWLGWFSLIVLLFSAAQFYGIPPLKELAHLPGIRQVAVGRWLYGLNLAAALMAPAGVALLLDGDIPPRTRRLLAAAIGGLVLAVLLAVGVIYLGHEWDANWRTITEGHGVLQAPWDLVATKSTNFHRQVAFLLLATSGVAIALLRPRTARVAAGALIIVAFVDLFAFGSNYNATVKKADLYPETPAIAFLREQEGLFRIAPVGGTIPGYTANIYGLQTVAGYDHYHDQQYLEFLAPILSPANVQFANAYGFLNFDHPEAGRNVLALLNVKYVVFPPDGRPAEPWLKPVYLGRDLAIYGLDTALPRVWGVGRAEVLPSRQAAEDRIASNDFDPATIAVFAAEDVPNGVPQVGQTPGSSFPAQLTSYGTDAMTVRTDFSKAGFLILSERFDDAWQATVDGSGTPVLRADGILRAVSVGPGVHTVELSFRPWDYVWGARISLITALLTALGVAIYSSRPMWRRLRPGGR